MDTAWIAALLSRELATLKRELAAYPDDAGPWRAVPGVTNTAGTLALHMAGNLRHFIGAQFGGTGYVRDRDAEFGRRDVPRAELTALADAAIAEIGPALARLSAADLAKPYPLPIGGVRLVTGDFLMHLAVHLAYHLGQVDYHRRMVTGEAGSIGAIAPGQLHSAAS